MNILRTTLTSLGVAAVTLAMSTASAAAAGPSSTIANAPAWAQAGLEQQALHEWNGTVQPLSVQPISYSVNIGTGDYITSDYKVDSTEGSSPDTYLIEESTSGTFTYTPIGGGSAVTVNWGDTCGPNATHNALTHFGNAEWVQGLSQLENTDNGTGGTYLFEVVDAMNNASTDNWTLAPKHTYNYVQYSDSTQSSWQSAYEYAAGTIYMYTDPAILAMSGYIPQFGHDVQGHYVVAFGYSGYGQGFTSESIDYFDSSLEHPSQLWYSQYISTLSSDAVIPSSVTY